MGDLRGVFGVPSGWASWAGVAAGVSVVGLVVAGAPAAAVPVGAPVVVVPALGSAEQAVEDLSAPDGLSASVLAKLRGARVEDLSQRTELGSVFALPDGSWQAALSSGPVWVRTGGDGTQAEDWAAVDTSLSRGVDGDLEPVAVGNEVSLSGGEVAGVDGVSVVAEVTDAVSGITTELTWPGDLPVPSVAGPRARYAEVREGVDMVVEVTSSGVEQYFVVKERPAVGESVELPVQVAAEGATAVEVGASSVDMVSVDGVVVAGVDAPLMWDATADAALGNPVTRPWDQAAQPALWAVNEDPDGGAARVSSGKDQGEVAVIPTEVVADGDSAELVMTPTDGFLQSPQVRFPVVVDPSVTLNQVFDTMVQSNVSSSDLSSSTDLLIGTWDGGATKDRSFLGFTVSGFRGTKVTSATLNMFMYHSYSCSAREWQVWSTGAASTTTRWSSQPTWAKLWASPTSTQGYSSSCADGWVNVPITSLAQAWADGTANTGWVGLRAASETDSYGWKRFYSGNASSGKPTLTVTYNAPPVTPQGSSYGAGQYAWYPSSTAANKVLYVRTLRPSFSAVVMDADAGAELRAQFDVLDGSTEVWSKVAGTLVGTSQRSFFEGVSGAPSPLVDGRTYTARSWAHDGWERSAAAQTMGSFTVDVTPPAAPTVTADGYADGQWLARPPASNTFTFAASAADLVAFEYRQDGGAWVRSNVIGDPVVSQVSWNPGEGAHVVEVRGLDKAQNVSVAASFSFGSGGADLSAPLGGSTSTDTFTVEATAPPGAGGASVTPTVYWRTAGTANGAGYDPDNGSTAGWTSAVVLPAVDGGQAVSVSAPFSAAAAASSLGMSRVPLTVDVQVCFAYSAPAVTRCTWNDAGSGTKPTVTRVPHAFGDAFPTADAGPGQVALWTGEFNTAATDVSVPGYVGALSVSRTYSTLAGPDSGSVFGPGWAASFDGTDIGVAGFEVVDNTSVDGTFALVDTEGGALIYRQPGDTQVAMKPGSYTPVDEDTAAVGARLTVTGAGLAARLVLTQDDGTVTTFSPVTYTPGQVPHWAPVSVAEPGSAGATTFTRDTAGRTTQILAPVPPGVTCTTLVAGCRALQITYATVTAGADVAGQVKQIAYTAYDPQADAVTTTPVAAYGYDSAHRLVTVTDPRTGLSTGYGYSGTSSSGQPLLTTVTPPGQAPFTLTYGSTSQDATSLVAVARADAGDGFGAKTLGRFVYGIDPTGPVPGLPAMTAADVRVWGQTTAPTYGAAVFGQDHQGVTTSNPGSVAAGDWPYADVQYTDDQGRVVNTAAYGAGAWQLTATGYDAQGRVIRELDQRAIDQIRQAVAGSASLSEADLDSYATITRYNADVTTTAVADGPNGSTIAAGTVITAAGTVVTDTWSPAAPGADGELVRTHTHTDYDSGAPNQGVNPATGIAYRLPTAVTVMSADPLTGSADPAVAVASGEPVLTRTTSGYAPIDGAALTDPTSGWTLGQATTTTVVTDVGAGTGLTSKTRFDADGRVVETRQPASNGTDEGTTRTAYYTAAAQSGETAACGSKPAWAGLVCRTWHAGATLPVITTTYSRYLAPALVVETSGAATRTTSSTFDAAGRVTSTVVTATGLAGSAPVPETVTVYDAATGQVTAVVAQVGVDEVGRIATGFDGWGRTVSYTDTDGQITTTGYDRAGRVASVTDPEGVTTFAYDGDGEHRGVVTGLSVTNGTATRLEFTATYDAAGDLVSQTLPGGVTQTVSVDRAGQEVGLAYTDPVGDLLAGWSSARDGLGRVVAQTGSSATGGPRVTGYTYDDAARLVGVQDLVDQVCTTRGYTFDVNGNRTGSATTVHDPGTGCAGAVTAQAVKAWTFDAADRVVTGANATGSYVYDALGRQTVLPGVDTPNGAGAGDLTVGYFDTDLAHTLTQDGVSTTFTLDPAGRRATATTTSGPVVVRHYADTSDNPAWATSTTGGVTSTTRYLGSIGGDLSVQVTDGVPALTLTDPHGDAATTITVDPTTLAAAATTSAAFDEYGNALTPPASPGAISYGWLAAKERATNPTTGLVLMGVRLYNAVTGLFTTVDPVAGGNTTAYTYPQDPINKYDLDGKSWWSKARHAIGRRFHGAYSWARRHQSGIQTTLRWAGVVAFGACLVVTASACALLGVGLVAANAAAEANRGVRGRDIARHAIVGAVFIGVGYGAGKLMAGAVRAARSARAAGRPHTWVPGLPTRVAVSAHTGVPGLVCSASGRC